LEKFKKVCVNPDLSFQKTQKELTAELIRRRKAGDKDIYICVGQIVKKSVEVFVFKSTCSEAQIVELCSIP